MIIAVSYKDNEIFEHFGHAEMFAVYKTNDDNTEIISKEIVEVKESGHQAVADLMDSLNVDAVIVGNIGVHARAALAAYGIVAFAGFCGNSDDAAELLMRGQLPFLSDEGGCAGLVRFSVFIMLRSCRALRHSSVTLSPAIHTYWLRLSMRSATAWPRFSVID